MNNKEIIKSAIETAIQHAGSQKKLGEKVDVTQQTISHWLKTGRVPEKKVKQVEIATDGVVRRESLCPDLFQ